MTPSLTSPTRTSTRPPPTTAFGALLGHITGGHIVSDDEPGKRSFQPMNVNFGLFPPLENEREAMQGVKGKEKGRARKKLLAQRALNDCDAWLMTQRKQAA